MVRKPLLPVVAMLALCIAAGPAILDGCVIACHARQDANTNTGGSRHCHDAASPETAKAWQATGGCGHDHSAFSAESTFQVRTESPLTALDLAVPGAAAEAPRRRGCGPAIGSGPSAYRSSSPAFALPLRV